MPCRRSLNKVCSCFVCYWCRLSPSPSFPSQPAAAATTLCNTLSTTPFIFFSFCAATATITTTTTTLLLLQLTLPPFSSAVSSNGNSSLFLLVQIFVHGCPAETVPRHCGDGRPCCCFHNWWWWWSCWYFGFLSLSTAFFVVVAVGLLLLVQVAGQCHSPSPLPPWPMPPPLSHHLFFPFVLSMLAKSFFSATTTFWKSVVAGTLPIVQLAVDVGLLLKQHVVDGRGLFEVQEAFITLLVFIKNVSQKHFFTKNIKFKKNYFIEKIKKIQIFLCFGKASNCFLKVNQYSVSGEKCTPAFSIEVYTFWQYLDSKRMLLLKGVNTDCMYFLKNKI